MKEQAKRNKLHELLSGLMLVCDQCVVSLEVSKGTLKLLVSKCSTFYSIDSNSSINIILCCNTTASQTL